MGRYAFLNKLMQRQVTKIMLNTEMQNILDRAEELKKATADARKKMAADALIAEQNKLEVIRSWGSREGGRGGKRSSLAARLVDTLDSMSPIAPSTRAAADGKKQPPNLRQATRVPAPKAKARSIRSRFRKSLGAWKKGKAERVPVVQVDLQSSADPSAARL